MVAAAVLEIEAILDDAKVKKGFKSIEKELEFMKSKIERQQKRMEKAFLAVGLSILFTGMAIKRVADQGLKSIINTASLAFGEMSRFSVLTNELSAKWEFFKFSIMSALMETGAFETFIGFANKILDRFNDLGPTAKANIGLTLVGLSILGGVMMIVGQSALALLAVLEMWGVKGVASINKVGGAILFAGLAWYQFQGAMDENATAFDRIVDGMTGSMFGLAGIFAWKGMWKRAFGVGLLAAALDIGLEFKEELGMAFGSAYKLLADLSLSFVSAFWKIFVDPIFWAMDKISRFFGGEGVDFRVSNMLEGAKDQLTVFHEDRIETLRRQREQRNAQNMGGSTNFNSPQQVQAANPGFEQQQQLGNPNPEFNININSSTMDTSDMEQFSRDIMDESNRLYQEETGSPLFGNG